VADVAEEEADEAAEAASADDQQPRSLRCIDERRRGRPLNHALLDLDIGSVDARLLERSLEMCSAASFSSSTSRLTAGGMPPCDAGAG